MKNHWPDYSYDLYKKACAMLNYPAEPFGPDIEGFIRQEDIVADIGCGIGIPAVYLAGRCRKVIAIDSNQASLDYFRRHIIPPDVKNITIVQGSWPRVKIEPCDAAVAFYVSKIVETEEGLAALLGTVKRGGIITCIGTSEDSLYKSLADRLGLKPRASACSNGCYSRGKLEMAGCRVHCRQVDHDFGQPVNDLEEAARFICWQLQLEDSYLGLLREIAPDYVVNRGDMLYVPKIRSTCVLTFEKHHAMG